MPFTDPIPWTNGDTITEQKLDQMVANAVYLRDELQARLIASAGQLLWGDSVNVFNADGVRFIVSVDGGDNAATAMITATGLGSQITIPNVNISAYSNTAHNLGIRAQVTLNSGGSWTDMTERGSGEYIYRFYKTPDMLYLTLSAYASWFKDTNGTSQDQSIFWPSEVTYRPGEFMDDFTWARLRGMNVHAHRTASIL